MLTLFLYALALLVLALLCAVVQALLAAWQTGGFLSELGVLFWAVIALSGLIGWALARPLAAAGRKPDRP